MLSAEEAFIHLEQLPSVEVLINTLQKCRKEKNLSYATYIHVHMCLHGLETHAALGNHLVPMFVDCGGMPSALQVFNRLTVRNEHAWTSLMQGFIELGKSQKALSLYEEMLDDCIPPSKHTLVSTQKACARLKCVEKGHEIHIYITKNGFESDLFVGNTLVDMYARCGLLVEAQEVFDKLHSRDAVTWNALVTGYAEQRHGEEVLNCLEEMQQDGVSPDTVTYLCSIRACSSIGAIEKGRDIHYQITERELESDSFLSNTLVDMYAKCGSFLEAQDVFDELLYRDVVSWNTLITQYAEQGHGQEALDSLVGMQVEGVSPDAVTFTGVLKACGDIGALEKGAEMHIDIVKRGFESNSFVGNALLDLYAKLGAHAEAGQVFDKLPVRDVILWNALIAGYAEHGLVEEVLNSLEEMRLDGVSPVAITFLCCLKACGIKGAIDRGQELHSELIKQGVEGDSCIGNTLVDMYVKCGFPAEAREVFDKLPLRDVVSWSAIITGYSEMDLGEKVMDCFKLMQLEGVSGDAVTYVGVLKACVSTGSLKRGEEMHSEIVKKGWENDVCVGNALVAMYSKCGSLLEAEKVFDKLLVQDVLTWNTLVTGYSEHGLGEEAHSCLEKMQLEGTSPNLLSWNMVILGYVEQGESEKAFKLFEQMQERGLLLNHPTYLSILKACGDIAALDRGKRIHAQVYNVVYEANEAILGTALIDMYGKCGSMIDAQHVFDTMDEKTLVTWNALIIGHSRQGEIELVLQWFKRMREEGQRPDDVTYLSILTACSHAGLVDTSLKYFQSMRREYGIVSSIKHYTCLVDLFGRTGQLDEAVAMLKNMPLEFDLAIWCTVLGACQKWGNAELGRWTFESAVRRHEELGPTFVLMSNIYVDANMCDDMNAIEAAQENV